MTMNKEGDLRIWHSSNFGRAPYVQPVSSIEDARMMLDCLASYDLYQGEDKVPMNAQGLEVFEAGGWLEWMNADGLEISSVDDQGNTLED